jgi:uncharacterized protein (TIGR03437 family)
VIPVTLAVNPEPQVSAAPASLEFTYQVGGAWPPAQSFAISTGNVPLNYIATSPGNWLQLSPTRGVTPGTVLVTANPSGLAPGSYGGKINVSAYGASNVTSVAATLTVSGTSAITATPNGLTFTSAVGGPAQSRSVALASGVTAVSFTAASSAAWLGVTPSSGTTPASISISINPVGLAAAPYSGTITVTPSGGLTPLLIPVALVVGSSGGVPTIQTLINAASGSSGAVAPGEIVAIFGDNLGPVAGASFSLSASDTVPTTLGGTQVMFDNVAVPLFYSSNGQVNALVPFDVASEKSTVLKVTFSGQTSAAMTLPVQVTLPGLFTDNASGTGEGAILNSDNTVNSASKPAQPGLPIQLFGTGGGVTNPPSVDGALNPVTAQLGSLQASTSVLIGGQPALVQYAGPAPGLVAGVYQINVVVPSSTPSGAVTVVVNIGNNSSPSTVTVQVQ